MVQETLLSAWRGLAGFEERASLRSWLYRIATNRCLNALRDSGRRPGTCSGADGPADAPEPTRRGEPIWLQPYPDALLEGAARPRRRPRRPLRDQGGGRPRLRLRPAADAAAPAGGAGAARRARLPRRRGGGDAGHQRGLGQQRPAAGAGGARGDAGAPGRRRCPTRRPSAALLDRFSEAFEARRHRRRGRAADRGRLDPDAAGAATNTRAARRSREFLRTRPHLARAAAASGWSRPGPTASPPSPTTSATPRPTWLRVGGIFVLTLEGEAITTITRFGDNGVLPYFGLPRTLPGADAGTRKSPPFLVPRRARGICAPDEQASRRSSARVSVGSSSAPMLSEALGDEVEVTLIDKNDSFVFGFSKLDVMFGRTTPDAVRLPYAEIAKPGVRVAAGDDHRDRPRGAAGDHRRRRPRGRLPGRRARRRLRLRGHARAGRGRQRVLLRRGADRLAGMLPTFTAGTRSSASAARRSNVRRRRASARCCCTTS